MLACATRLRDAFRRCHLHAMALPVLKGERMGFETFRLGKRERDGRIQPAAQQHNRAFHRGNFAPTLATVEKIA